MVDHQSTIVPQLNAEELKKHYSELKAAYDKVNDLPFDPPFSSTSLAINIQTEYKKLTGKNIE